MSRNILFALFTVLFTLPVAANTIDDKTKELHHLQQRMRVLDHTLSQAKDKRATLDSQLHHIEVDINHHQVRLQQTHQQWQHEHKQVMHLRAAKAMSQSQVQMQLNLLKQQIRASYQIGQQEHLQLLLNQQDPVDLSRLLTYYDYLAKSRSQFIRSMEIKLNELDRMQQTIKVHTDTLQSLIQQSTEHLHALNHSKSYQQVVISKLTNQIQSTQQELEQIKRNKQALEKLVQTLKLSQRTYHNRGKPFSQMLHNLVLPTQGSITTRFGDVLGDERARSNGIFIRANEDTPVHAIYPGRVIFANWMRGFGLLLIIDHGQGFLSLYAHNNSLYQKVGDIIHSGDLIAKVGHTGGQKQDGLYVEIRQNGKPIDPLRWLARSTANHTA